MSTTGINSNDECKFQNLNIIEPHRAYIDLVGNTEEEQDDQIPFDEEQIEKNIGAIELELTELDDIMFQKKYCINNEPTTKPITTSSRSTQKNIKQIKKIQKKCSMPNLYISPLKNQGNTYLQINMMKRPLIKREDIQNLIQSRDKRSFSPLFTRQMPGAQKERINFDIGQFKSDKLFELLVGSKNLQIEQGKIDLFFQPNQSQRWSERLNLQKISQQRLIFACETAEEAFMWRDLIAKLIMYLSGNLESENDEK
ncbi:UNKNOWN [Stylonychia lemnae]|uniref:Uncharacterized protein n=1 Tax=Stylonychia lemnae TaxID=5949 RepID=A0A078AB26_STYLE|nr:UNKNOWN [Stylonychia lemnae]|eukprot:CDW77988.1 UNKNOWN [Stylonychia lemnae]